MFPSHSSVLIVFPVAAIFFRGAFLPEVRGADNAWRVDRFGQSLAKDYPGKVRDAEELRHDAQTEADELAAFAKLSRDPYGGLPGSGDSYGLKATGFFHLAKVGARDVLVTPDGNLFFQLGVCGLMPLDDYTYVGGRETDFAWLPPRNGDLATAWLPGGIPAVSFYLANWVRKFGQPFDLEKWSDQSIRRLRAWGFNSGGAWSQPTRTGEREKFPFARMLPLTTEPRLAEVEGTHGLFDPFADGVEPALDRLFAVRIAAEKNNPLVIGYFTGNEQLFENVPKTVPALTSHSAAKRRLVELLRARYSGDIAAFNQAWAPTVPATSFASLADLALTVTTARAAADVQAFTELFIEAYYRIVAGAFRRHDPNHLLLGSRWQPGTANNESLVRIAARYVDVISVNYYTYAIEQPFLDRIHTWSSGKPLLLSEWYYGCSDTGLGGGKEVSSQHERGLAYRNYVENTAALPYVVGHEWFIYLDQPITGRYLPGTANKYHGEAYNTGLVNVVDRPYRDFIVEAAKTNARIYDLVLDRVRPYVFDDPRFAARAPGGAEKIVIIPRAEPGMKIDGVMSHWPGRPGEPVSSRNLVSGKNAGGLSADFRLCWDNEFLYVFVQVQDATPARNRNSPSKLWKGDSVELFVGGAALTESGAPRFDDRHILFGANEVSPRSVIEGAVRQPTLPLIVVRNVSGNGYAIEAGIPWSALGAAPANGREFRFDLGINDSADGRSRLRQLMWNGTARNTSDRSGWGRARLSEN
jgi:hypothetical protein